MGEVVGDVCMPARSGVPGRKDRGDEVEFGVDGDDSV